LLGGNHAVKQLLQRRIMNGGFSHKKETSASRLQFVCSVHKLIEQSHQSRRGLLPDREHFAEIGLGCNQRGLLRLLGRFILREQVFDLSCGSVAINGLLQRSHCRVGLLATGLGTTAATAAATAATAATAAIATDGCPGVHHFLNEWLDRAPVGVVGDFKRILVTLHLHLLKICAAAAESTTAAAAAATAATAAATTESAAATAAAESLREDAAGAHHQSCRHSADG
jgi:hypothetical protein